MRDTKIEVIKSKFNNYIIKKNHNGFYCEVKTRNIIKLLKEYFNDAIGVTYIHPQFLTNMYFSSIDGIKNHIQISIKLTTDGK